MATLLSALTAVIPSTGYLAYAEFLGTITEQAGLQIFWYQADRTTPSATPTSTFTETADGSRNFLQSLVTSPSDARWARLRPYRFSGTHEIYFYDVDLKEMLPAFFARMTSNQTISSQGATVLAFDSDTFVGGAMTPFDATGDFVAGSNWFHPRSDGMYELDALVRVYAADDSQVPSYIDVHITSGGVIGSGPTINAVVEHVAHFPLHIGPVWLVNEMAIRIRFHAFGACTVYSSGSWFAGRMLL